MNVRVTITVRRRLWLRCYLRTLMVFCVATGMEPDWDKLSAIIKRGLVLEVR
jgi:hypothetical protein